MGYIKGYDGVARTMLNPLEGSIGDVDLDEITANTVSATGNVTGGNVLTGGLLSVTGNVTGGNLSVATGNISGNVLYTPAVSGDWANAAAIYNVKIALDALANAVTILESGTGFTFLGPFSNDATAAAGGVAIGQVYFNNSGGLVVRQTQLMGIRNLTPTTLAPVDSTLGANMAHAQA